MALRRRQFGFGIGIALAGLFVYGVVMAQECPISAPLTLKDTQSGFAGETGTVWTVAADCSFTVARQIGPKTLPPHKRGQLTPEQQAILKDMMGRIAIAALPDKFGAGSPVNARRITLSYAGKQTTMILPPGGGDPGRLRAMAGDGPAGQILELAQTLKQMMDG
jgi:hypothetical protein